MYFHTPVCQSELEITTLSWNFRAVLWFVEILAKGCNVLFHWLSGSLVDKSTLIHKEEVLGSVIQEFETNAWHTTYSYIVYLVKIEYVSRFTIFGLKMMMNNDLKIVILKFLHAHYYFTLVHKREDVCPKLQIQ